MCILALGMKNLVILIAIGALFAAGCQKESIVQSDAQRIAAEQAAKPQEQCAVCGNSFPEGSLKPYTAGRACQSCIDAARAE